MRRTAPAIAALLTAALLPTARLAAQQPPLSITWSDRAQSPREAIVGLDHDDDDDDGVPDSQGARVDPAADDDVAVLTVRGATTGAVRVTVTGGLRGIRHPTPRAFQGPSATFSLTTCGAAAVDGRYLIRSVVIRYSRKNDSSSDHGPTLPLPRWHTSAVARCEEVITVCCLQTN